MKEDNYKHDFSPQIRYEFLSPKSSVHIHFLIEGQNLKIYI